MCERCQYISPLSRQKTPKQQKQNSLAEEILTLNSCALIIRLHVRASRFVLTEIDGRGVTGVFAYREITHGIAV